MEIIISKIKIQQIFLLLSLTIVYVSSEKRNLDSSNCNSFTDCLNCTSVFNSTIMYSNNGNLCLWENGQCKDKE